ncbi:MAG: hypothetical protein GF410_01515 [Chitinivibrionales bacterium]|nr:hypothetical protein [Chitinivibrionales bacterium]
MRTVRLSSAVRPVLAACAVAHMAGCAVRLPHNLDEQVAGWYLNPTEQKQRTISAYKLSSAQLDSLLKRAKPPDPNREPHSVMLADKQDTRYALGILPPETFHEDSLYPLVIYLHGGVGTHKVTKGEDAYQMFAPLADSLALFVASPSANRIVPWWSARGLERILRALRYMSLQYPIDPDRVVLAGVSDGATGCWAAASAIPGPFAGFIAVSGFGGMLPRLNTPVIPANLRQRPIYNVNAGKDHLYPIEYVNSFLDRLVEEGVDVRRKVYPDAKHGFDYREQELGTLAGLVRSWRRPRRTSVAWTIVPGLPNVADNLLSWTSAPGGQGPAFIRARFDDAVLTVRADGIERAVLTLGNTPEGETRLVVNDGPPRAIKPQSPDTSELLRMIQHTCFPRTVDFLVYSIDI